MVGVGMSEQQAPHLGGIETVLLDARHDALRRDPGAGVDQRVCVPSVDEVHIAVDRVRQVQPEPAAADDVYSLGDPHVLAPSPRSIRKAMPA